MIHPAAGDPFPEESPVVCACVYISGFLNGIHKCIPSRLIQRCKDFVSTVCQQAYLHPRFFMFACLIVDICVRHFHVQDVYLSLTWPWAGCSMKKDLALCAPLRTSTHSRAYRCMSHNEAHTWYGFRAAACIAPCAHTRISDEHIHAKSPS